MDAVKTIEEIYQKLIQINFEHSRRFNKGGYTPENLRNFLKYMGNPQDSYPIIHIAGSVAKGSVSHLLSFGYSLLGEKVGLYTSPHLLRINERIQVEGKEILDEEFVAIYQEIEKKVFEYSLSFFDTLTAIAFLYFAQKKISLAVVETGLGGRLDSTNVVQSKVAIITRIDLDHQNILGHSIKEIAYEKAGIIKENSIVYSMKQEKEAEDVLKKVANEKKAKWIIPNYELSFDYRKTNISFVETYFFLQENKYISLEKVKIPGRFENLVPSYRLFFDCAHNRLAMQNLAQILQKDFPDEKVNLVFNCLKERNPHELLAPFLGKKNFSIFMSPWEISGGYSFLELSYFLPKLKEEELYEKVFLKNEVVVITGSMRLYAEVHKWLKMLGHPR